MAEGIALRHRYYFDGTRLIRFSAAVPAGELRSNEDWIPLGEDECSQKGRRLERKGQVADVVRDIDRQAEIVRGKHLNGVPHSLLDYPDARPDFDAPTRTS